MYNAYLAISNGDGLKAVNVGTLRIIEMLKGLENDL